MEHLLLTAVQARILLSLFLEGSLCSSSVLKKVGISGTSWSKERKFLAAQGLIFSVRKRELTDYGIAQKTEFELTKSGRLVSQHLLAISSVLSTPVQP